MHYDLTINVVEINQEFVRMLHRDAIRREALFREVFEVVGYDDFAGTLTAAASTWRSFSWLVIAGISSR